MSYLLVNSLEYLITAQHNKTSFDMTWKEGQFDSDSMFLVSIQWLKIPMGGLSDSIFLVSIQCL